MLVLLWQLCATLALLCAIAQTLTYISRYNWDVANFFYRKVETFYRTSTNSNFHVGTFPLFLFNIAQLGKRCVINQFLRQYIVAMAAEIRNIPCFTITWSIKVLRSNPCHWCQFQTIYTFASWQCCIAIQKGEGLATPHRSIEALWSCASIDWYTSCIGHPGASCNYIKGSKNVLGMVPPIT